jgi:hypothetical protein
MRHLVLMPRGTADARGLLLRDGVEDMNFLGPDLLSKLHSLKVEPSKAWIMAAPDKASLESAKIIRRTLSAREEQVFQPFERIATLSSHDFGLVLGEINGRGKYFEALIVCGSALLVSPQIWAGHLTQAGLQFPPLNGIPRTLWSGASIIFTFTERRTTAVEYCPPACGQPLPAA